ncbi:MAG: trans-sulfuration enzyme family protein [Arachnia sp.]
MPSDEPSRLTRGLRAGFDSDPGRRAVVPPLYLSTNYSFSDLDTAPEFDYSRSRNPTRSSLDEALTTLHAGAGAVTTATGMAALSLTLSAVVPVGGRVIAPADCYGGTWRLLQRLHEQARLVVDFVDTSLPSALAEALREPAALVLVESPSNPLLRVTDIAAAATAARDAGALLGVDNTFCSPLIQRPLDLGADIAIESTTKLIAGHSDALGGAVIAASPEIADSLAQWCNTLGVPSSPFDAYLTLRGLRTLDARLRVQQESTLALLDLVVSHPAVRAAHHASLPDHPGHDIAAAQQSGPSPIFSFELSGGILAVEALLDGLTCFTLAESLGGCESLISHPGRMTHAAMSQAAQQRAGITDGLLRVSVGLEQPQDLCTDLRDGLDRAAAA